MLPWYCPWSLSSGHTDDSQGGRAGPVLRLDLGGQAGVGGLGRGELGRLNDQILDMFPLRQRWGQHRLIDWRLLVDVTPIVCTHSKTESGRRRGEGKRRERTGGERRGEERRRGGGERRGGEREVEERRGVERRGEKRRVRERSGKRGEERR